MIDKVSLMSTRIPYMNTEAKSSLATGLASQSTQTSLRAQLLEKADTTFTPDRHIHNIFVCRHDFVAYVQGQLESQ